MAKHKDPNKHRTRARAQALQLLFTRDFGGEDVAVSDAASVMDDVVIEGYACELYEGIVEHQESIDAIIEHASENWSLARMSITDRSILRIAAFELMYRDDVPSGVSINEAVELAQGFGGEDDSYRFVNGVLGKVAKVVEAGGLEAVLAAQAAEEPAEGEEPAEAEEAAAPEAAAEEHEAPAEPAATDDVAGEPAAEAAPEEPAEAEEPAAEPDPAPCAEAEGE